MNCNDELLKYAIDNGIINLEDIQDKIDMQKRNDILSKHPYKISEGKDGYWRTYIPDKTKGRKQIKKNTKNEVEEVVIEYWKSELDNPTLKEVFDEWNDRKLSLGKITKATHTRNIQIFNRHYSEIQDIKIKSWTKEEISNFIEEQIPKFNLTVKSFTNFKGITRGFLERAVKRNLIDLDVERLLRELDISENDFHVNIKEDYEEVFDEDEYPVIIQYLSENRDLRNLGLLLMFVTGIRVGELVALKHQDFDGNTFRIRRTETRYKNDQNKYTYDIKEFPKTKAGVRTVVVPESYTWICNKLKMQNPFEEFIFMENGVRLSTQSIRLRLYRVCKKLGIYRKSPHKIRKTYGTILLDNNIDKRLITDQMGHTSIACTENHYHRNRKSIEKKSSIISNIPEFHVV